MSHKSQTIASLVAPFEGQQFNAHYLGFFDCFNRQLFFEAHEVLEEIWLKERGQPKDLFYKGLIQLAGAFVHITKQRPGPAIALLRLALANLNKYPGFYEGVSLENVRLLISNWMTLLQPVGAAPRCPATKEFPTLRLPDSSVM